MPADPTPWLTTMTSLDGLAFSPSDGKPNPKIQSMLTETGAAFPKMASYCNSVINEDYFSWCGLAVGYCMAKANIPPVFGSTDVTRFLFAAAWLGWGTPVTTPQTGDVVVFDFGGGDHHVSLFEKDNGDGFYSCHGGNQSHVVNVTKFSKRSVMGIRRPSADGALPQVTAPGTLAPGDVGRAVTALQSALASHGFDPGGIDGEFGPLTSAAVSDFQRANNLPVTGMADPATLQKLDVSTDVAPDPSNVDPPEAGMQSQDLLKLLVDALVTKQSSPPATPAQPAGSVDIGTLIQTAIAALTGQALPAAPPAGGGTAAAPGTTGTTGATGTTPPALSIIDQLLGGQALVGKKTLLGVVAYVVLAILQSTGTIGTATGTDATTAGQILTTLIGAFTALGGVAKVDRLTQAINQTANQAAGQSAGSTASTQK